MQTINITEEVKADAAKLINAVDVFRSKYGFRMVSVDAFTHDKRLQIFGDRDETEGFNAYYIYPDRQVGETYIEGDKKEESEEIEEEE